MDKLRIVVGADDAGYEYKEALKRDLDSDPRVEVVTDVGVGADEDTAYPHVAVEAARMVADGKADRALLVCGTGLGVAISANKVPGIRAAVCHDPFSTARSRKSNDCQILCMGARIIAPQLGCMLVEQWLECDFEGGGSTAKVERIKEYEQAHLNQENTGLNACN